ncbi:hypothetical protein COLO4_06042 [Corchorus olitorius]|uniref:Uncharacterized protein n=1 Tax=Corchorus olitorius TaxID=93759 RepID=A0A1R3KPE0_9ROSI|nr:hypothetical protein COLO4_06042 [Corchorus olitorius]
MFNPEVVASPVSTAPSIEEKNCSKIKTFIVTSS